MHSDNSPLAYILTTARLVAMNHRWVAQLATYNLKVYYKTGNSNVEVDALSKVKWKYEIQPEAVKTILNTHVEVSGVLSEVYAYSTKACLPPIMKDSSPTK